MSDCCDPASYQRFFDAKHARRRLKSYRTRGLDPMATRLVDYLEKRDIAGRTVLEVGGGIGAVQVELLKAGAARSVNVELSGEYEEVAAELLASEGLANRAARRVADFVEDQDNVGAADLVMLNRVICCYPWVERLMEAAVAKSDWLLGLVVPRDRALSRLFVATGNCLERVLGHGFRSFVHPVDHMERMAAEAGLATVFYETDLVWQGMVFERS